MQFSEGSIYKYLYNKHGYVGQNYYIQLDLWVVYRA